MIYEYIFFNLQKLIKNKKYSIIIIFFKNVSYK
jgi:hypothetical protein